jgi:hypothetical protein
MTATYPAQGPAAPGPGLRVSLERLRCLLLWLTGASGAIVFIEPSPYEVVSFLTLAIFLVGGLTLSRALLPLGILLILINIGYSISASALLGEKDVVIWVMASWYLAATAMFFAAMLGHNTEARLAALTRGCLAAGVIAAIAAIVGYARVFHGLDDILLLYERSRGTFKDPNVLGAFMILPALLALERAITGRFRQAAWGTALLALFAAAILLSFSRAAWGQLVLTSLIVLFLTMASTRSPALRLRIVLLSIAGLALAVAFVGTLLSIESVGHLFKERAELEQSYDVGSQGRFARHILGAIFALDVPLGIGPLQFTHYFPEDPHNSYLNAFMSGGWLSGACYPALVAITLAFGLRAVFVATPWRHTLIAVYASYVGVATESFIIDSDHWRHAFLLLGVLWGLIAATQAHTVRARTSAARNVMPFAHDRPALAR